MIVAAALLFLFGTTVSAGPLIPSHPAEIIISKHKHDLHEVEYLPPSGPHPFISNFIQKGTNVFFKPQFMMSSGHLPPQMQHVVATVTKDDCEYPHVVVEEPLHIVEEEIVKEPPKIQHIVEIEKVPHPIPTIIEAIEPVVVAEPPKQVIIEFEETKKPIPIVPPAPVLPPFEMPELPVIVDETHLQQDVPCDPPALVIEEGEPVIVTEPLQEVKPIIVTEPLEEIFTEIEEVHEPIVIPPAPVLPPMEMPELPVLTEEHDTPCETPTVIEEIKPVIYTEPVAEVPENVVFEIEEPKEPIIIPPAPFLPPMELPELPVTVEEPHVVSELPCPSPPVKEIKPVLLSHPLEPVFVEDTRPIVIPSAPVLRPVEMPVIVKETHHVQELPKVPVYVEQIHEFNPILVPSISDFQKDKHCVDEILVERVLPRLEKSFKIYPGPAFPLPYAINY